MPKLDNLFPSKYLKASQFIESGPKNYTIETVTTDVVGQGEDADVRPIVTFTEKNLQGLPIMFVLNKTNGDAMKELFGTDETDDWAGKQIQLHADKTRFGAKIVDCIRVREAKELPAEALEDSDVPF